MATEDLNLSHIRSLNAALAKLPTGTDAVELAKKLGLWTTAAHMAVVERQVFKSNLSALNPDQISDEAGLWTAEFGRITELGGVLIGQREQLKVRARAARAEARSRARAAHKDVKPLPATAVNDQAEEDPAVIDQEERLALVETLLASTNAAKEVTQQYLATLSREISFRDAQLKARIYS
jgi:hypothetical protein